MHTVYIYIYYFFIFHLNAGKGFRGATSGSIAGRNLHCRSKTLLASHRLLRGLCSWPLRPVSMVDPSASSRGTAPPAEVVLYVVYVCLSLKSRWVMAFADSVKAIGMAKH